MSATTVKFRHPAGVEAGSLELYVPEGETCLEITPEALAQFMKRYAKPGHREGDVVVKLPLANAIDFFETLGFRRVLE